MTEDATAQGFAGRTAAEIAAEIRGRIDRGALAPGEALPPVRRLAADLGVNRNTAVAAYRQLAAQGLVTSHGRGGTRVAQPDQVAREGFSAASALRDVASGNPDPRFLPDPRPALAAVAGRPVLYGAPAIDPELEAWAHAWLSGDLLPASSRVRVTATSGAADALDRLLAGSLAPGDAVAIEEPGFLTGIHLVRVGGYRAIAVPVDDEGMTVSGLRRALDAGARAIVCTPRAQNPTGAALSRARAAELRAVLADHPYALVIEDDHFSLLSTRAYHPIVPAGHERFALVRSVSKFLGPDLGVALVGSDPETAARLGLRLRPGTAWVSHLLQRVVLALLTDPAVGAGLERASAHYARQGELLRAALGRAGVGSAPADGLSVWTDVAAPANAAAEALARRGWLARSGDAFRVASGAAPSTHLRLTGHELDAGGMDELARAVASAAVEARGER
ncbi:aminotransferase class I/II-fold pyridoxal phosphate-dependent enzyme [Microbacterium sp. ZXX196]|uniref:aminotransferase class I/II-fold pyridoxal phosphate-dependent enzyme n=1 Tax=Microbacterium sp. ZXX196 TaxID=2609291 RepID=UPI0012B80E74|nr:aminotransferase class I/II-fold pyridoxal phosphate-dependent enzyme [Microbacterium sp. ZXX196]MTE24058.1 aminotransferase class I/II-fold pyridoxal phosphate-dependent enzyme [Microbacterium sp. ZXX196]